MHDVCCVLNCLGILVLLGLSIAILLKLHSKKKEANAKDDYPKLGCAYNCQAPYGNTLSPQQCAAECNNPKTTSKCCEVACHKDSHGRYVNCDPPEGLHCGTNCD